MLEITGGGASTGTFTAAAGTNLIWKSNYDFNAGTTFTGAGAMDWQSGTHTLGASLTTLADFTITSDVVISSGRTFSHGGSLTFAGNLSGGGTLSASSELLLSGGSIDASTLKNSSGSLASHHATFLGQTVTLNHGAIFRNEGNFATDSQGGFHSGTGTGNRFVNSGSFTREESTDPYTISCAFEQSGSVSVNAGRLELTSGGTSTSGTWSLAENTEIQLLGEHAFAGNNTISGLGNWSFGTASPDSPSTWSVADTTTVGAPATVQQSGILTVTGTALSFQSGLTLKDTDISGPGQIHANGPTTLDGVTLDGSSVTLAAGATHTHASAAPLEIRNGAVLTLAGTFLAESDHDFLAGHISIRAGSGAAGSIHQSGVFRRQTGTGYYSVGVPFHNSGTVTSQSGVLAILAGGSSTDATWDATGGLLALQGDFLHQGQTTVTGNLPVQFNTGVHTVQGPFHSTTPMQWNGATTFAIAPGQTLTADAQVSTVADDLLLPTVSGGGNLLANGGLSLQGLTLDGATLTLPNAAVGEHTGTQAISLLHGATFENSGTFTVSADGLLQQDTEPGPGFRNLGTFRRTTSAGTYTVDASFENSGTVSAEAGTLVFNRPTSTVLGSFSTTSGTVISFGTHNQFDAPAPFTGSGEVRFLNGNQDFLQSATASATLVLSGGAFNLPTGVSLTTQGGFRWSSGTIAGGGLFETQGASVFGGAALTLDGSPGRNAMTGTVSFESTASLVLKNSAHFENLGTMLLLNDGSMTAGDATAVAIDNAGTITRDTSPGLFLFQVPFNHSGIINLNRGSIGLYGGGTATNSVIHTLPGTALYVGDQYTFGPNNVMTGAGVTHFANGSLHVTGSLSMAGAFEWTGGTLDGSGTFSVGGGLTIAPGPNGVRIDGSTLENASGSEAVISGTSNTYILNGGIYRNAGTTRLHGNNNFSDAGGGDNRIENAGLLVREEGTGNYTVTLPIHNSGVIRASSGSLLINAGGSLSAGALETAGGNILLNGGVYEFSSGQVSGTPVLRITGTSSKGDYTTLNMDGGTIRNEGTYSQSIEANYDLDNGGGPGFGTIENTGTWNLTHNSTYSNSYGAGVMKNSGLLHQSAGNAHLFAAVHHQSGGTTRSTAGNLYLRGGGSLETGATLDANGGSIYFYGGTHTWTGGTLTGSTFSYSSLGTVVVEDPVSAVTGAATGGFGNPEEPTKSLRT